jgi:Holliday junction resolvase-like predicted endonuclease
MNQRGESVDDLALQQNDFKLIAHYWWWRFDEIDLIPREKMLVFVEIRPRTSTEFGNAADSIMPPNASGGAHDSPLSRRVTARTDVPLRHGSDLR